MRTDTTVPELLLPHSSSSSSALNMESSAVAVAAGEAELVAADMGGDDDRMTIGMSMGTEIS